MSTLSTSIGPRRSVILLLCVMLGCGGGNERIEHYPISISQVEFPDSVVAGVTDTLVIGAMVGFDRCQPERVRVERRADSLFVTGMAHCVVHYTKVRQTSEPGVDTSPARPNPLWLSVPIPPLGAGRYFLLAGGLSDTLFAVTAPVQRHTRLAGHGSLVLLTDAACPVGLGIYASDWPFRRVYEVLNPPQSIGTRVPWELHATLVGLATCDSTHAVGALRLRTLSYPNSL